MKKSGFRNGKQKYKCHTCGKQFLGGDRINLEIL
ncbi:MAG: IS1/IS1595 family N-terminal zinc-binding domain-containing protein [Vicingaceae bacterium]